MTGWWLVSYIAVWALVLLMSGLIVGMLREIGLLREARHTPAHGKVGPELGSALPEISLQSANGFGPVILGRFQEGSRTLLVFMGPMCSACQRAVEALNKCAETRSVDRLKIAVVLSGSETASTNFMNLFPLRAPVVIDPDYSIARSFSVSYTPCELLYEENMALLAKGMYSNYQELLSLIDTPAPEVHNDDRNLSVLNVPPKVDFNERKIVE